MGGGKGGGGEAAAARADEQQRQQRIREGTSRINDIFNGSRVGDGLLTAGAVYDPTRTYYLADGTTWSPAAAAASSVFPNARSADGSKSGLSTFYNNGSNAAYQTTREGQMAYTSMPEWSAPGATPGKTPAEQFAEMLAGGKLYSGTKVNGGFNDQFFADRRKAFLDYATPQLEDQYGDAQRQLTFALARNGTLDSSIRADKAAELQKKYDLNKQMIADQAVASETDARNAVEDARANLIATLNASGDAQGAAQSALARAAALSKPAAYSPLTQLFADFTSTLGTQAALERANYYSGGQTGARYSTGLFAPNRGAVKVS